MSMIKIKESQSKRTKCSCCEDQIPTGEKYSEVDRQKYCHHTNCHTHYIFENHPDAYSERNLENDNAERHLRQMEDYGAYGAAGCQSAYWEDRDNGFCN